jgi:ABC-type ATPase with predicted acetyltransferase domain
MPSFDIIRTHSPNNTFRVQSVIGTYDLQSRNVEERFKGSIDLNIDWQIGLIVGRSGSGKTTIAKELFRSEIVNFDDYCESSVLDDMPNDVSIQQICKTFNAVGFSSPPSWLKPYSVLSNGEKMRVDLAKAMLSNFEMFAFDEFTSVVDRNVAKIGSLAMQKAIRRTEKKFIAISCHEDVQEWLMPDWVFNTNEMKFEIFAEKKNQNCASTCTKRRKKANFGRCLKSITI